jgi:dTDP-3-amino-3,4,6-trideoxy-alpha-D-glucose transaminase
VRVRAAVPFTRLDGADPELIGAVERVARDSAFTLGNEVESFEAEFADYCGVAHAIGVSSGTDALALALRGLGIGPGDEVIVPANSFIASAEAVTLAGARPRIVDVDPATGLLTAAIVERNLGPRVRCVMPVHLYGRTVDLDPIVAVARAVGAAVVEDACQAHGARYKGRRVGSIGDAGCFSFYPTKNLGAWGDGGAVVTSDAGLAERVRLLRSHGESVRHEHRVVGGTHRLHGIQAAILRIKLEGLDDVNEKRRRAGRALSEALSGSDLILPAPLPDGSDHVFHLFVVCTSERDALRNHLAEAGVATAIHYPTPIHLQDAYAHLGLPAGSLPVAERLAERICSLPLFPGISDGELLRIAAGVQEFEAARDRTPGRDRVPATALAGGPA